MAREAAQAEAQHLQSPVPTLRSLAAANEGVHGNHGRSNTLELELALGEGCPPPPPPPHSTSHLADDCAHTSCHLFLAAVGPDQPWTSSSAELSHLKSYSELWQLGGAVDQSESCAGGQEGIVRDGCRVYSHDWSSEENGRCPAGYEALSREQFGDVNCPCALGA